jgi:hypothetical protein
MAEPSPRDGLPVSPSQSSLRPDRVHRRAETVQRPGPRRPVRMAGCHDATERSRRGSLVGLKRPLTEQVVVPSKDRAGGNRDATDRRRFFAFSCPLRPRFADIGMDTETDRTNASHLRRACQPDRSCWTASRTRRTTALSKGPKSHELTLASRCACSILEGVVSRPERKRSGSWGPISGGPAKLKKSFLTWQSEILESSQL